ncbi:MAG: c-type cytochrome [bacterium]
MASCAVAHVRGSSFGGSIAAQAWRPRLAFAAACALFLAGCARPAADTAGPGLPPLEPPEVARGRELYVRYCASCHGPRAEGAPNWTRPDARGNLPPPPHDDAGHTWRHSDRELAAIISNGWRDPFNKTPDLTMPPFKDKLTEADIRALITYFKSLWSDEHRRWQYEESRRETEPSPDRRSP